MPITEEMIESLADDKLRAAVRPSFGSMGAGRLASTSVVGSSGARLRRCDRQHAQTSLRFVYTEWHVAS